jgi:hypothetical protein
MEAHPTMKQNCPHCGKSITYTVVFGAPTRQPGPEEPAQRTLSSSEMVIELERSLADHLQLVDVIDTEGKVVVQLYHYIPDGDTWRDINAIVKAHGGKYIKGVDKLGHWEVPAK